MTTHPIVWQLGLLLGFGFVLSAAADIVLTSATSIAKRMGLTSYALGFLLLGVLTSTPEFFVALGAAADGVPQLSVGNLIGGSILLLSFVMGISSVLLGKITLNHGLTFGEIVLSSAVVAAPAVVLWDGNLSRLDGAALVGIYLIHIILLNNEHRIIQRLPSRKKWKSFSYQLLLLAIGFVCMAFAARVMVHIGKDVADWLTMPPLVFGLILLSLGTNLPEIALAVNAAIRRERTVVFADFLGSGAANTLILGILAIISPFEIESRNKLFVSLVLLVGVSLYFIWALSSRRNITRKEGVGLLFFYVLFVAYELLGHG